MNEIRIKRGFSGKKLSLSQYVQRRNGVPLGASESLKNMLYRSFGASSFAGFWQYWNPIFSYGLGKYIYAPLRRFLPAWAALIMTFVVSGGIHDLVTMSIRKAFAFLFIPWFFLLGLGVVLGRAAKMDLSKYAWAIRAGIHLAYIIFCLGLTLVGRQALGIQ
ncbi:MAG: acyltransferase [Chloroflexi bacterium]|nr:acyltransferase [Chloroflexota bacterium]